MAETDPSSTSSANEEELPMLTPAEIERRVVSYLNGSPRATRDQWRRLGAHGMRWLYTIAVSEAQGTRANRLRAAALATVGQLAGATKLDALLDVVADPESSVIVRCGAIEGMGHAGLNRALPVLQTQAYHPDFKVRLYTCTALGRIATAGAARIVRDIATRDPHSQVRRAAQVELNRLKSKAATMRKVAVGE
ncbi:MAG: HEAT repeat domain-containing protein [Proteobacteria bacterium]|nr:HEAT repeat domain-containing protein [Pseudomonadota bacterium]